MKEKKVTQKASVGAVMVVGGGIAGIQASLDLANSGFKVYLVENSPSIGGAMAQLDKTFPTNDCAMCIMSPKLVDCARHLNIELLTYSEIESVTGEKGNFEVKVLRKSRYIDESKCTGCGECAEACPVVVPSEFEEGLSTRKAIYRPFPQAAPNIFAIQKSGYPPCRDACPARCNVQGYVALIRERKFKEALDLIRERVPLPAICGRICGHLCEDACNRQYVDESVQIRALKRFVTDYEMNLLAAENESKNKKEAPVLSGEENRGEKVAMIGSGPAGLTAAYDLAKLGYHPVVFEALEKPGGMLRVGIPKYRLPDEIIDYEVDIIKKTGVEIRISTPIGPDLTLKDLFSQGFKAIFIAIGTHKSRSLNIEGEDLVGVFHGVGFLYDISGGKPTSLVENKVVAVIGGGNTAIDTVRTALRFGAKEAFIIYRRTREQMPVSEEELKAAESEGIKIYNLLAPKRILGVSGKVTGLLCNCMKLGPFDSSGRRKPIPIEGKTKTFKVDIVIPAIGQIPELLALAEEFSEFRVTKDGIIPIEGVHLKGVHGFLDFLQAASLGKGPKIGKNVIVIGGGNVAIDVARVSKRLGAERVTVVCLESRDEMPAHSKEIEDAEAEGIIFECRRAPKRIIGKGGKAVALETLNCLSVFDRYGRFFPRIKEGTESVIEGDNIMVAVGQEVDYTLLKEADGVLLTKKGFLKVDPVTLETNMPGVFAGGDVAGAEGMAIHSIAHGHKAAISIDRYLNGVNMYKDRDDTPVHIAELPTREEEKKPRVDMAKLKVEDRVDNFEEVELGFTEEQAVKEAERCMNCGTCSECQQCVLTCKAEAINHNMKDKIDTVNVGSILLATGFKKFDPSYLCTLGYKKYPDVVTSLQFERILSASGPFSGHIQRPSDGKTPQKIAFIQCVGSRDVKCGNEYCSSVCCMYAIKEAVIAKEHLTTVEPTIFYMDMRTYGKDFDKYLERAKNEYGVVFKRSRVAYIEQIKSGKVLVRYESGEGSLELEEFDLVVLSVGLRPGPEFEKLAEKFNIELNEYNFCKTGEFTPLDTSRAGIFACGVCSGPKDIPETVMQASGAAAKAEVLLSSRRNTLTKAKKYPPEIDVSQKEPRIGVFVCHCGINIGGIVDVTSVVEFAENLENVVYAEENLYTCSQDTQEKIKNLIKEHDLNRVVVASCSPRTHEPLFQETIREAGLNRYLFEMANIRDQCSWIHMNEKEAATEKSKDLVKMAVAKVRLVEPLKSIPLEVIQKALVVGGGLAGMICALTIADQGFEVFLVEKENSLGGNLLNIDQNLERESISSYIKELRNNVLKNKNIKVFKKSKLIYVEGFLGNYETTIQTRNGKAVAVNKIKHGVTILATGAKESRPNEYLYGKNKNVLTQLEFEKMLASKNGNVPDTVVMIQCVGSREDGNMYCSRVCCATAIKNAIRIKEINKDTNVFIIYRDVRTYGFREKYYSMAREIGVNFIRYEPENKPDVSVNGKELRVKVYDTLLDAELEIPTDLLVLSSRMDANPENEEMSKFFKVPLNNEKFFLEAHMKLRPVDFATEGVFMAGTAHGPKFIDETIAQANAAAARACTIISKKEFEAEPIIAAVNEDLCDGCGVCVPVCNYEALSINEIKEEERKVVKVNEALCKGCGCCAAACPSGAMEQKGFKTNQMLTMIDTFLEEKYA